MWDLNSLTRVGTYSTCIGRQSLNHWTAREVPGSISLFCVLLTVPAGSLSLQSLPFTLNWVHPFSSYLPRLLGSIITLGLSFYFGTLFAWLTIPHPSICFPPFFLDTASQRISHPSSFWSWELYLLKEDHQPTWIRLKAGANGKPRAPDLLNQNCRGHRLRIWVFSTHCPSELPNQWTTDELNEM